MILTILGWLTASGLLAVSGSSAWHAYRDKTPGQWACAGFWACAAVIVLAALGALGITQAVILAVLAGGTAAAAAVVRKEPPGEVFGDLAESLGVAFRHLRGLPGWSRLQVPSLAVRARDDGGETAPEVAAAEAVAARGIPPVMEDPHLGPATEPGEIAAGPAAAPPPYAALAQWIAGFEPEDDMALRMFMEANAAGSVLVADAWHAFADTCLNSVGLDPAFVAGILEAGDSAAVHGSLLAQVIKRLRVIYAAVQEWVAGHGPLPHKARDFLTGDL